MPENMGFGAPQPVSSSFLEKLQTGLLGKPNNYGGMLSDDDLKAARQQAMMAMGAQLLQAGGPSSQPIGLGQAIGSSLMTGQQVQQGANENSLQALLMQSQIQKMQQGTDKQPNSVREYEYAKQSGFEGTFQDWIVAGGQSSRPSSVQEWEFYQSLPQEQKRLYLEMKRNPNFQVRDVGQVPTVIAPSVVSGTTTTPLSTLPQEAAAASQIAGATASGRAFGEGTATAKLDLSRVEDNASQMLALLDQLEKHPGRKISTGGTSILQAGKIPGTAARDFNTLREQIGGKQFLEAFNSLKGGGQITEVEGKKATDAIARIQDPGQTEAAYLKAIEELRQVVMAGAERARKKAGSTGQEDPLGIR